MNIFFKLHHKNTYNTNCLKGPLWYYCTGIHFSDSIGCYKSPPPKSISNSLHHTLLVQWYTARLLDRVNGITSENVCSPVCMWGAAFASRSCLLISCCCIPTTNNSKSLNRAASAICSHRRNKVLTQILHDASKHKVGLRIFLWWLYSSNY